MSNTEFVAKNGLIVGGNTRIRFAVGNTGQRPSPAIPGDVRFNIDTNQFEGVYTNGSFGALATTTLGNDVQIVGSLTVGNSTVFVYTNTTGIFIGPNQGANGTVWYVGNNSSNTKVSVDGVTVGANVSLNSGALFIGNSISSTLINSTSITINGQPVGGGSNFSSGRVAFLVG